MSPWASLPTEPLFVSPGAAGPGLVTTEENVITCYEAKKGKKCVSRHFFQVFSPPGPAEVIRGSGTEG